MLIRGSKLVSPDVFIDFETGVALTVVEGEGLEVNEEISALTVKSSGFINSPTNPDSPYNPANFVETEEATEEEPEDDPFAYPRVSPNSAANGNSGENAGNNSGNEGNNGNSGENSGNSGENAGNNNGDGGNNGNNGNNSNNGDNNGHHSNGTVGPDGIDYFNPESEIDVPLVLGEDRPNNMVKGQTWLTFDEFGQGVLSVYNGQEWSKVGEELRPLDIGTY